MKRLVLILAIVGAVFLTSSQTAEAHRWRRGYFGHRVAYYAPHRSYYRGYYAYPRYPVVYRAYYGPGYYGGFGVYVGW